MAHYRINQNPDGSCFIRAKQLFGSIPELIEHHTQNTSGLPVILSDCIPKQHAKAVVISKDLEEKWELVREKITLGKMLGAGNYGEVYGNFDIILTHHSCALTVTVTVTVTVRCMCWDCVLPLAVHGKLRHHLWTTFSGK